MATGGQEGEIPRGDGGGGARTGGRITWGADRQGRTTLDGEEQHQVGNRRGRRTENGRPRIRAWERENRRGGHYGVV